MKTYFTISKISCIHFRVSKLAEFLCFILIPAIDLVKKLLTLDAKKRITTAEALQHPWMQVPRSPVSGMGVRVPDLQHLLPTYQDEEVIASAKQLMSKAANSISMPPPHLPMPSRKRSAPSSDEDASSPTKPTKRRTVDAPSGSPVSEAPPIGPPPSNANQGNVSMVSIATTSSLSSDNGSSRSS